MGAAMEDTWHDKDQRAPQRGSGQYSAGGGGGGRGSGGSAGAAGSNGAAAAGAAGLQGPSSDHLSSSRGGTPPRPSSFGAGEAGFNGGGAAAAPSSWSAAPGATPRRLAMPASTLLLSPSGTSASASAAAYSAYSAGASAGGGGFRATQGLSGGNQVHLPSAPLPRPAIPSGPATAASRNAEIAGIGYKYLEKLKQEDQVRDIG
jgi:hypothetical protein